MGTQLTPHGAEPLRLGPLAALRTGGDGPVALLVPGCTGSKEDFAPVLDPLAAAGYDAVAVDLPGQQDSPGPDDEDAHLPGPLGEVIAGLVAGFERPVVLLGHSYGGLVARAAVLAGAPVAGLTLLSSGPGELPHGPRRQLMELSEPMLRAGGVPAVARALDAVNATNPRWLAMPVEQREFVRARFLRNTAAGLIGMGRGLREEPDRVAELAHALRVRGAGCLVTCGELDDAWPIAAQREMAERLEADFGLIPAAAHSATVENPDALLAVLLPTWKTWLDG